MATKGASNRYGNARGGRQGRPTQHTGFAWAKAFNKSTLADGKRKETEHINIIEHDVYL